MELKKLDKRLWCFIVAVAVQFCILFYTSVSSNKIIENGTVLKFRMTGYDPHDFFRGEYIRLRFKDNMLENPEKLSHYYLYVEFNTKSGYAVPSSLSSLPEDLSLHADVSYTADSSLAFISYPFDRLWMNQEECKKAEQIINDALRRDEDVYALVSVDKGEGRLLGVEIGGIPLKQLINDR